MWVNYHTHSNYCDGKGSVAAIAQTAAEMDLLCLGFSSHAPLPFQRTWCMQKDRLPEYLQEIDACRPAHSTMEIYKGLEVDFVPNRICSADFAGALDYTIGSIHFVDAFPGGVPWEIDASQDVFQAGLEEIFHHNIMAVLKRYFMLTKQMVQTNGPTLLGHLDKIKVQNTARPLWDEADAAYRSLVEDTLLAVKQAGTIVEVNTRGIYQGKTDTLYPSPWILERIAHLGIPITLSSDAHRPDDLTRGFSEAAKTLRSLNFTTLTVLTGGTWKQLPFDEHGLIPYD